MKAIPPSSVAKNAKLSLEKRAQMPKSRQGMTRVGLARANQLANQRPVSKDTLKRMASYCARHKVDKKGSSWSSWGKGRQAWYGWGGDAGCKWARKNLKKQ